MYFFIFFMYYYCIFNTILFINKVTQNDINFTIFFKNIKFIPSFMVFYWIS